MEKRVKEKKGGFTVEMNGMRYRHSNFSRDVEDVVGGDDEVDEAVVPGGIGILIKCISKIMYVPFSMDEMISSRVYI